MTTPPALAGYAIWGLPGYDEDEVRFRLEDLTLEELRHLGSKLLPELDLWFVSYMRLVQSKLRDREAEAEHWKRRRAEKDAEEEEKQRDRLQKEEELEPP